jgi:hypothetical protein
MQRHGVLVLTLPAGAKGSDAMTHRFLTAFAAALLAGAALACPVRADDSALLNRSTPAPNVLIILDTSQSMTWYNYTGSNRGDEYLGYSGDNTPMARMAMAKSVLSTVVDTYFDKLRLGMASYAENGSSSNPNENVRIKRYFYYCTDGNAYCTDPSGGRQYITFIPPTSSLASGGTTTTWNQLQLSVNSSNISMPSQST